MTDIDTLKAARTSAPVHPLIAGRWSPRGFDSERALDDETIRSLLEAARWAASSRNEQPWRFIVGRRGAGQAHARVLETLDQSNAQWAQQAPLLLVSVAKRGWSRDGSPNRHALHDVGLAVAQLTLQATALGLGAHQMAGFSPRRARELFAVPEDFEPVAVIAIGYRAALEALDDDLRQRELAQRTRKPLSELAFADRWGEPAELSEPEVTSGG
ncbi:MAG: nitroreductase family protein [Myxococcales bacterium]|nr:nitroreductase family protein [Myxococcales bacterium]